MGLGSRRWSDTCTAGAGAGAVAVQGVLRFDVKVGHQKRNRHNHPLGSVLLNPRLLNRPLRIGDPARSLSSSPQTAKARPPGNRRRRKGVEALTSQAGASVQPHEGSKVGVFNLVFEGPSFYLFLQPPPRRSRPGQRFWPNGPAPWVTTKSLSCSTLNWWSLRFLERIGLTIAMSLQVHL